VTKRPNKQERLSPANVSSLVADKARSAQVEGNTSVRLLPYNQIVDQAVKVCEILK
jgi:hypothetical protein